MSSSVDNLIALMVVRQMRVLGITSKSYIKKTKNGITNQENFRSSLEDDNSKCQAHA